MLREFRGVRALAVFLFVLTAAPPAARAQTTTATLRGVVLDASGAVLPGTTITLRNRDTGFTRSTVTDGTGGYVLPYVPAGTYELAAELSGFKTLVRQGLRFEIGQELTIDLTLEVSPVGETVTVRGEAPLVETTKSTLGQVVSREQIDTLPLPGRQAATLAQLVPGVVPRASTEEPVTAGGQPRGSGEALVDGVSNEGMAVNSVRSNAPPDAIQEFQVLTSQFAAEFGNASGVVLNTITRSGTNEVGSTTSTATRAWTPSRPAWISTASRSTATCISTTPACSTSPPTCHSTRTTRPPIHCSLT